MPRKKNNPADLQGLVVLAEGKAPKAAQPKGKGGFDPASVKGAKRPYGGTHAGPIRRMMLPGKSGNR